MNAIVTPSRCPSGSAEPATSAASAADDITARDVDLDQFIALTKQEYLFRGDDFAVERVNGNVGPLSAIAPRKRLPSAALPFSTGPIVRSGRSEKPHKFRRKVAGCPASLADPGIHSIRFGAITSRLGLWAAGLTLLATIGVLATKYTVALFG